MQQVVVIISAWQCYSACCAPSALWSCGEVRLLCVVCRRLLTDEDPALRERLFQVLFSGGKFQWARLINLIQLAKSGGGSSGLDLSETVKDAVRLLFLDEKLRKQMVLAFTEDNRLHVQEVAEIMEMLGGEINPQKVLGEVVRDLPSLSRSVMLGWADRVLVS